MENKPFTQPIGRLPHETLHAYHYARELLAFVARHRAALRGLPGGLTEHLEKSSVSALLNIAEAGGRISGRDRKSRFAIARGEISEAAAALDAACLLGALGRDDHEGIRGLLVRLSKMLYKLSI